MCLQYSSIICSQGAQKHDFLTFWCLFLTKQGLMRLQSLANVHCKYCKIKWFQPVWTISPSPNRSNIDIPQESLTCHVMGCQNHRFWGLRGVSRRVRCIGLSWPRKLIHLLASLRHPLSLLCIYKIYTLFVSSWSNPGGGKWLKRKLAGGWNSQLLMEVFPKSSSCCLK